VAALLAAMLLLGVASGVHCIGMCGGFVAAFSGSRIIPIRNDAAPRLGRLLVFNMGRISTYAALGAAAGALGHQLAGIAGAQSALYVAANVMLVAVGLQLAGVPVLSRIETLGVPLWRRVQPLFHFQNSFFKGLAWGFIPCGLVYGALAAAAFAGSAPGGAAAMVAYGLGTLPWLLAAGFTFSALRRGVFRRAVGATVLGFGVYGLAHADAVRSYLCL